MIKLKEILEKDDIIDIPIKHYNNKMVYCPYCHKGPFSTKAIGRHISSCKERERKQNIKEINFGTKEHPHWFIGANPTVDVIILRTNENNEKEMLLVKRSSTAEAEPGKYAMPGGFQDTNSKKGEEWKPGKETPIQAAAREVKEETKLDISKSANSLLKFVGVFEKGGRDSRDSEDSYSKSTVYLLDLPKNQYNDSIKGQDDVSEAKWFNLKNVLNMPLAFDHKDIIKIAIKKYNIIKLNKIIKEISAQAGNWGKESIMDVIGDEYNDYNINYNKTTLYKGYRFSVGKYGNSASSFIFIIHPTKNFIIGAIRFTLQPSRDYHISINQSIAKIKESVIHKRFRGQGLGRLLYQYFAKKYKIIMSDGTLYEGSFQLWQSMDEYFPGTLFGYSTYSNVYFLYDKYTELDDATSYFLFFYDNIYIKNHTKMMEDKRWILDNEINPDYILYFTYNGDIETFKLEYNNIDYGGDLEYLQLIVVAGDDFRAKVHKLPNGQLKLLYDEVIDPNQLSLFDNENK